MFIAPFDKNDVFAFFVDDVADQVPLFTLMLDHNFVARNIRAIDTDIENIVPGSTTIHLETVLTTDQGLFKAFASSLDLNKGQLRKCYFRKKGQMYSLENKGSSANWILREIDFSDSTFART